MDMPVAVRMPVSVAMAVFVGVVGVSPVRVVTLRVIVNAPRLVIVDVGRFGALHRLAPWPVWVHRLQ
jgi:hypothetical protein